MYRKKILVVDDSDFFAAVILKALTEGGYDVVRAGCGEEGLRCVREEKPDLVLLDIIMPGMSGFEVCRVLRSSENSYLLPIIMLTSQHDQEDMIIGLDLGADDYIFKPFDSRELLCRVKNTLKRLERSRDANPLTGLPGNLQIRRELDYSIERNMPFAAIYADLDNFKAYNDMYGFLKGDDAIKLTAEILREAMSPLSSAFLGHIGGDDFMMVVEPAGAEDVCRRIIESFDTRVRALYSAEDFARGYINTYSRRGEMAPSPVMSISLAIVTNEFQTFQAHLQVSDIAAELKKKAKSIAGSTYVKDMRKS